MTPATERYALALGHLPAWALATGRRPPRWLLQQNAWALAATVVAAGLADALAPSGDGWLAAAATWALGHAAWSVRLLRWRRSLAVEADRATSR